MKRSITSQSVHSEPVHSEPSRRRTLRQRIQGMVGRDSQPTDIKRGRLLLESLEKRQLLAGDADFLITDGADPSELDVPAAEAVTTSSGLSASTQAEGELAPDLVQFAEALTALGVRLFGAHWCPICTQQKQIFEDGANELNFVEVTNGDRTLNDEGVLEGITMGFPVWEFPDLSRSEPGEVLTLAQISERAGAPGAPIPIPQRDRPTFEAIGPQTVLLGSPLQIPVDAYVPDGRDLTVTVTVDDPTLLQATVLSRDLNRSLRFDMNGYEDIIVQLFEEFAPRPTERLIALADADFYDDVIFHRVVSGFVIQGGDPTGLGSGGSTLGDFDDQFHVDLQHNRTGILSYAKSSDDTNDSQFFLTERATRGLDGNHSVAGIIVEGDEVRKAISETATIDDRPTNTISINTVEVFRDTENSVVMLKAIGNRTGSTNVTFTVTDPDGSSFSETVLVTVANDTANTQPWLDDITPPAPTTSDVTAQLQLTNTDVEGDAVTYFAQSVANETAGDVTLNLLTSPFDPNQGQSRLTLTPDDGFSGSVDIQLGALAQVGEGVTFAATLESGAVSGTVSLDPSSGLMTVTPADGFAGSVRVLVQSVNGSGNLVEVYAESITNSSIGTVSVNKGTGLAMVTAPTGFTGDIDVGVGVTPDPNVFGNSFGDFDTQLVTFEFEGALVVVDPPSSVDLQADSDTGTSNVDNVTRAGSLSFDVNGVTSGAVVDLVNVANGVVLGTETASGPSVVITTNNISALGNGTYGIAARQTFLGVTSALSTPLTVVYDSTAPASVIASASTQANVDRLYESDLVSNEEGGGLVYSLTSSPSGVSIDGATGVISWTPTAEQLGTNTITLTLTDAAGNTRTESFDVEVAGTPLAGIKLEVTDLQGTPITSVGVGDVFLLNFIGVDLRFFSSQRKGVFAAFADVLFNSALARPEPGSAIEFHAPFTNVDLQSGTFSNGLIDELGAIPGSFVIGGTGLEETLVATIRMEALAAGTLNIRSEPADDDESEVLIYGENNEIPANTVEYGSVSLAIGQNFTLADDTFPVGSDVILEDSGTTTLNVLANDTVLSGSLTVIGVTQPSAGATVTLESGIVRFRPNDNFNGPVVFTYRVSGANGVQESASVTVNVTPVNDLPTANADTPSVEQDSSANPLNVLTNDSIAPDSGETLRISAVGTPSAGGMVSIVGNGQSLSYTPAAGFIGTETFTYTISDRSEGDSTALTHTAQVTVTVAPSDEPPTAVDDAFPVGGDVILEDATEAEYDVLGNDLRDVDNETFVIQSVGEPNRGGSARISLDGTQFFYRPAPNFNGTEQVSYTIRDTGGGIATGTVTFTITPENDLPPILNPTLLLIRGASETQAFALTDLPANPDSGETLSISSVAGTTTAGGTARRVGDTILYTPPNADFTGSDSFTFTISDGSLSSTGTVNVEVADFELRDIFVNLSATARASRVQGITLSGTNLLGQSVNLPISYSGDKAVFENVLPGDYTITIPAVPFLQNATVPRQITVSSAAADGDMTVDSGIGRLRPNHISIRDSLGSAPRMNVLAAVAPGSDSTATLKSPSTDTVNNPVVSLNSAGDSLTIRGTNSTTVDVEAILPALSDSRVQSRGEIDGVRLFKISLEAEQVTFNPVTASGAEGESAAAAQTTLTVGQSLAEGESIVAAAESQSDLFVPVFGDGSTRTDVTVLPTTDGELWVGQTLRESEPKVASYDVETSTDVALQGVADQPTLPLGEDDSFVGDASKDAGILGEAAIDAAFSGPSVDA